MHCIYIIQHSRTGNTDKTCWQFKKMAAKQVVVLPFSLILALGFIPLLVFSAQAIPFERLKSLRVIKKVNQNGPFLGLITVYAPEEEAFFKTGVFKSDPRHPFVDLSGRVLLVQLNSLLSTRITHIAH